MALALALVLLKLLDTVLVSFCKTVIAAPLDIMQRPHSALGDLNLDLKQRKKVCRDVKNKYIQIIGSEGPFNLRKKCLVQILNLTDT